jgi:hypothetical protein
MDQIELGSLFDLFLKFRLMSESWKAAFFDGGDLRICGWRLESRGRSSGDVINSAAFK